MNITFKKFEPNKVHRITVPILFDNLEDSKLAKVNGWPVIMYEYFECTWKGGLDIPEHISVDTINMTVGDVIRLRDCTFAPGLKPRLKPNHKNPVIATLKGSRRGLVTVEEDDD